MAVVITDEELQKIQDEAHQFIEDNEENINWELVYNLKRENLTKDLIISKLTK